MYSNILGLLASLCCNIIKSFFSLYPYVCTLTNSNRTQGRANSILLPSLTSFPLVLFLPFAFPPNPPLLSPQPVQLPVFYSWPSLTFTKLLLCDKPEFFRVCIMSYILWTVWRMTQGWAETDYSRQGLFFCPVLGVTLFSLLDCDSPLF